MAEFCKQCADEMGFNPANQIEYDFVGMRSPRMIREETFPIVLCEGCGVTQVDWDGSCIGVCSLESKHTKAWKIVGTDITSYPESEEEHAQKNNQGRNDG